MNLKELIDYHLELRPLMEAQDMFKLLYQGEFGVGHLITRGAFGRLQQELNGLDYSLNQDSLLEPVSYDGTLVRVNLRPFILLGHKPERLFDIMIQSGGQRGDYETFMNSFWELFALYPERFPGFKLPDGLPSHSIAYKRHYNPAYRVVEGLLMNR